MFSIYFSIDPAIIGAGKGSRLDKLPECSITPPGPGIIKDNDGILEPCTKVLVLFIRPH